METIISVVMGDLVTRSVSFLIDRYLKPAASSKEKNMERLQWMLMRVRVTVEEAEVRCITNEAMLQQLKMLKEVMYRGYYMLDTFIQQAQEEEKGSGHGASHSLPLSKFSSAKRVRFSCRSKYGTKKIEDMLECVEIAIASTNEFVIFLRNYPPMFRQPYSAYLFIENCMFGRQLEMERVINFLLHEEPPVDGKIGVLPIVGPGKVGKTTLIEHVCRDENVRKHFFRIILLSDYDFIEERQCALRDQGRIKYRNDDDSDEVIFLIIVELVGTVDESAWRRLHSAYQSSVSTHSKIIVTSRSKDIINFGTTQALILNFLSQEAYWYFFKALLFGSADPEEQPKLASIAMTILDEYFDQDIYTPFTGTFICLRNTANLLKAIPGAHNWHKVLKCFRENRQQNERFSRRSLSGFGMANDCIFLRRVTQTIQYCVVHNQSRIVLDSEEAPNITMIDIVYMKVPPRGKFEILLWKSHLPSYHKHIYSCEIFEFEGNAIRDREGRKRKNLS